MISIPAGGIKKAKGLTGTHGFVIYGTAGPLVWHYANQ